MNDLLVALRLVLLPSPCFLAYFVRKVPNFLNLNLATALATLSTPHCFFLRALLSQCSHIRLQDWYLLTIALLDDALSLPLCLVCLATQLGGCSLLHPLDLGIVVLRLFLLSNHSPTQTTLLKSYLPLALRLHQERLLLRPEVLIAHRSFVNLNAFLMLLSVEVVVV